MTGVTVTALTRSDTGETPSGVDLPYALSGSGGSWSGSPTDTASAPAPLYLYSFVITFGDGSTSGTLPGTTAPAGGYTGRYTSSTRLKQRFGAINIAAWTALNGQGPENVASTTQAIQWAEDEIDAFFAGSPYTIPFVATGAALPSTIPNWADSLAGPYAYFARGLRDEKIGGDLKALQDRAYEQMAKYRSAYPYQIQGVTFRSDVSLAPTIVNPRTNPISSTTVLAPSGDSRHTGVRLIPGYGIVTQN